METWGKVTTRSQVSIYRSNDLMETIAAIQRWPSYAYMVEKKKEQKRKKNVQ